ncbi:MAG: hypothetical protein LBM99_00400 [Bacillales bacterium]|jgi:hypothetical protein|nr:hypothetical protein [Bacillales bacterium]
MKKLDLSIINEEDLENGADLTETMSKSLKRSITKRSKQIKKINAITTLEELKIYLINEIKLDILAEQKLLESLKKATEYVEKEDIEA